MAWTLQKAGSKSRTELAVRLSETSLNDADKALVFESDVGLGSHMELTALRVELTTTATVGTRTLQVTIEDSSGDVLFELAVDANTLAASGSKVWQFGEGLDPAVTSPQYVNMPRGLFLVNGTKLRVRDSAGVDPTGDDLVLHVMGIVRNA